MKLFLALLISALAAITISSTQQDQKKTTIFITLENTNKLNIERRSFFRKQPVYDLAKIDDQHYVLNYLPDKPGMIYIHGRPMLITPYDDIKLTYRLIVYTYDTFRDTLIAEGKNAENYTFSNYTTFSDPVKKRTIDDFYPDFKSDKYRNNMRGYFNDIIKNKKLSDKYLDSLLSKKNYDQKLIDYLNRSRWGIFFFGVRYYEDMLAQNSSNQLTGFSKKVDSLFSSIDFIPSDSCYSAEMENSFRLYFGHLTKIRFKPLNTEDNFEKLFSFVRNYPNPFVREYFLYFLISDYKSMLRKSHWNDMKKFIADIKNPEIIAELKNQQIMW